MRKEQTLLLVTRNVAVLANDFVHKYLSDRMHFEWSVNKVDFQSIFTPKSKAFSCWAAQECKSPADCKCSIRARARFGLINRDINRNKCLRRTKKSVYILHIESSATKYILCMCFRDVVALIKLLNEPLHDTNPMGSRWSSSTKLSLSKLWISFCCIFLCRRR